MAMKYITGVTKDGVIYSERSSLLEFYKKVEEDCPESVYKVLAEFLVFLLRTYPTPPPLEKGANHQTGAYTFDGHTVRFLANDKLYLSTEDLATYIEDKRVIVDEVAPKHNLSDDKKQAAEMDFASFVGKLREIHPKGQGFMPIHELN